MSIKARKTQAGLGDERAFMEMRDVLIELFTVNDAMNQLLLSHLDARAWRAELPRTEKKRYPIAAIFAHIHNCRRVWLKESAPHLKCPPSLNPRRCTQKQTASALKKSAAQCVRMVRDALSGDPNRRVRKFSRGSWTRTWPAGVTMFGYMFAHDAHHRGQISMLAHQLGYRLPVEAWAGIWWWDKLWKQAGFKTKPR